MSQQIAHGHVVVHVPETHKPAYHAYQLLHWAFVAAPVIAASTSSP